MLTLFMWCLLSTIHAGGFEWTNSETDAYSETEQYQPVNLDESREENPSDSSALPNGVILKNGTTYDYIVVGAGAAGTATAARLALAGADVLLVEAGGDPNFITQIPGAAQALLGSELDWKYPTIPNDISCLSSRNKQCRFSRGKCLGGSTSINFMIYVRGNRKDFDRMGIQNWTWADMEPWYKIYEGFRSLERLPASSIPYHNTSGIMNIEFFPDSGNSWHPRMFEGFNELNVPVVADVNAESQIGVSQVVGYVYNGERMSTARAYLTDTDVKKRLKLAKNTHCTGVTIDNNNVAHGISVVSENIKGSVNLFARKEVIVSAGTIGTPKLLMLSGIGPANHLTQMGVTVRQDLPVGENMKEQVLPLLFIIVDSGFSADANNLGGLDGKVAEASQWLFTRTGPLASIGLTDIAVFLNTRCYDFNKRKLINDRPECDLPNFQLDNAYIDKNSVTGLESIVQNAVNLDDEMFNQVRDVNKYKALLVLSPIVLEPKSRGYVKLATSDPLDTPAIFPNFLSDKRDLQQMLRSITIVEHLIESAAFKSHNASLMRPVLSGCPKYEENARDYWACYCRHLTYPLYHAAGTAALGRVVDERLRVRGVSGLRVADLSVLPEPPHGNSAATAIALGERAAHFIKQDNHL